MKIVQTELTTKEIVKLGKAFEQFVTKNKDGTFKKKDIKLWEFINCLNPKK